MCRHPIMFYIFSRSSKKQMSCPCCAEKSCRSAEQRQYVLRNLVQCSIPPEGHRAALSNCLASPSQFPVSQSARSNSMCLVKSRLISGRGSSFSPSFKKHEVPSMLGGGSFGGEITDLHLPLFPGFSLNLFSFLPYPSPFYAVYLFCCCHSKYLGGQG